jgi:hypothetical protein
LALMPVTATGVSLRLVTRVLVLGHIGGTIG